MTSIFYKIPNQTAASCPHRKPPFAIIRLNQPKMPMPLRMLSNTVETIFWASALALAELRIPSTSEKIELSMFFPPPNIIEIPLQFIEN